MANVPASDVRELATPGKEGSPAFPRVGWLGQVLMLAAAFLVGLVGQFISFKLWIRPVNFSFAWIPGGVLLAILVLRPRREWPAWLSGVLAGCVCVALWRQASLLQALGIYLPNFIGVVLVALYLQGGNGRIFDTVPGFSRYFLLAVLLVPAVTGLTTAALVHSSGFRPGFSLLDLWLSLAPNFAMGYLLIGTMLLAFAGIQGRDVFQRWARVAEAMLIAIGLLLLSIGLWILVPASSVLLPLLLFAPVPLIMLAAMRFGSPGAALALFLVSVPAAWMGVYGGGQFRFDGEQMNAHVVQLWLLAVGFLVHALAIVSRQYESVRLLLTASHRHARSLAGRLMQGQEEERSRIARELHDDVNQQIASLAIAVSSLKRLSPDPVASGLDELHLSMLRLSEDVRRISHNLHPGLLEHVGLGAALDVLVREAAERWDGQILYEWEPGTSRPGTEATVCMYRIAQEALRNAIAHSQARHIRVQLEAGGDGYLLVVEDDGIGFDLEQIYLAGGLGLLSMQERAALQGGRIIIVSNPGAGTQVRASIPREARP
ncbi:sensor histidine kinase [Pseudoxanthomonas suwonensis]|uniref:sensor histidine kinase n=1 Tax=Pseudoxanthomonas suwonensis TaxID=314722 RepID=UPI0006966C21|nr:ATP-binding protein [Pseudoxanthomonas suwonensis]